MEKGNDVKEIIQSIEETSRNYLEYSKYLTENINSLESSAKCLLDIFSLLVKLSELPLKTVSTEVRKTPENAKLRNVESILKQSTLSIPKYERFEASNLKGTVVFINTTKNPHYFMDKEDYSGFVIFNSYIVLAKAIVKHFNGRFVEYTDDGVMFFFKDTNYTTDHNGYKYNESELMTKGPLNICFLAAEYLKNYAKNKGLIEFHTDIIEESTYQEPSLIYIGASYGNILDLSFRNTEKLLSKTTWEAANRCRHSKREVRYSILASSRYYYDLPIKVK